MKYLTTFLLLLSLNAMADSVVLTNPTTVTINTDQPATTTNGKIQQDAFVVFCPDKNLTTNEKLQPVIALASATVSPAANVIFTYTVRSGMSQQMGAMVGGAVPLGAGKAISSGEQGESLFTVNTYGATGAKNSSFTFQCTGVSTATPINMQATPTALPIDTTKGYVAYQLKNNLNK